MLSNYFPLQELSWKRQLGIGILLLELVLLCTDLAFAGNHLAWRWQFGNVILANSTLFCPLILSGAAWLALPLSSWRKIAKFITIAEGVLYSILAILVLIFANTFMQPPEKRFVLRNGDIISVSYNDQGALGGSVCVLRERDCGMFFKKVDSRCLSWCDPKVVTLPNGKQMLANVDDNPVDIDQFFLGSKNSY